MNVQVACTIHGSLAWISDPVDGSRHDNYCQKESGALLTMDPKNWIGDKGYIGNHMIIPFRKQDGLNKPHGVCADAYIRRRTRQWGFHVRAFQALGRSGAWKSRTAPVGALGPRRGRRTTLHLVRRRRRRGTVPFVDEDVRRQRGGLDGYIAGIGATGFRMFRPAGRGRWRGL
jgi:hypothetical protein